MRVMEQLREIFWESKRAPSTNSTAINNPYRREFLKKKFFGKTLEARRKFKEEFKVKDAEHRQKVDAELMGL